MSTPIIIIDLSSYHGVITCHVRGHQREFRLYAKDAGAVDIRFSIPKGKAIIKKLELYEIKNPPPGFQFEKYGE